MPKINTAEMLYEIYLSLGGEPVEDEFDQPINTVQMLGAIKEDIDNGGGGGGGGGNIVLTASFDEEENVTITGASFDDISSGIKDGRLVVYRYVDEENEAYMTIPIMAAFFDDAQDLYTLQIDASGETKVYALNKTDTTWTSVQPTPPTPDTN